MKFKFQRLKIVEQIITVAIVSVIIPVIITAVVINNINRQAIRRELGNSAKILAATVDNNINGLFVSNNSKVKEAAVALKYIKNSEARQAYLDDFCKNSDLFIEAKIMKEDLPLSEGLYPKGNGKDVVSLVKTEDNEYLAVTADLGKLTENVFQNIDDKLRQIYLISNQKGFIVSLNGNKTDFSELLSMLPPNLENGESVFFGDEENRPMVCRKSENGDFLIIVNTTEELAGKTVYTAGRKIITAISVFVIFGLILTVLYISSLYINIRQLFKGITALSTGNYSRRIRLIKSIFTPYEVVFLTNEFNKAADEISKSYSLLEEQNKELARIDEFRSNLIDTVSHEFRTPLTSIMGYTSRLLRTDITIDKEMLQKCLLIIKRQSERLSRMVEDLLVIPDMESSGLNLQPVLTDVIEVMEHSISAVKTIENRTVIKDFPEEKPFILVDRDRFEQIIINLLENAGKYSYENSEITASVKSDDKKVIITIKNKADYIKKSVLDKLSEKFTRVDDKTTRTTRGTGLGLYIVKGLVEAMNGKFWIFSEMNNVFGAVAEFSKGTFDEH